MKALGEIGQSGRSAWLAAGAATAFVALLPFLAGTLSGQSFFYRDLSLHFFPLRRFAIDGLLRGELRYWNPFVQEGGPLGLLPISYPLDLLQLLWPDERGFSVLLALHVPLAAVAFLLLARGLGQPPASAAAGSLVYALGGFALSSLNLYAYLQALAWAPLVVLSLLRASGGGTREVAVAALGVGLSFSTTALEFSLQTLLFGVALHSHWRRPGAWIRIGVSVALGLGLVAQPALVIAGVVGGTSRGSGIPTEVVLAQAIHPLTLVQTLIGSFHGDLSKLADRWWGDNFFSYRFPYFASLYLGAIALSLAVAGLAGRHPWRWRLSLLAAGALLVCLGPWAGLRPLVDALPRLRLLRFPSKAFFSVHLTVALLASLGIDALLRRDARSWRALAASALAGGSLLVALPLVPHVFPEWAHWFSLGFFPPYSPWPVRLENLRFLLRDAALGGVPALMAGLIALAVRFGRLSEARAVLAASLLLAADLLRTGSGLNPTVSRSFYRLSDEVSALLPTLREGRVFTCLPSLSPAFLRARSARGERYQAWMFATLMDTLTPSFNVPLAVRSAYSVDLTLSVPSDRTLPDREASCADFGLIQDRLRGAGVQHVLSPHPLNSPSLEAVAVLEPARLAPLAIHVYRFRDALPLYFVARDVHALAASAAAKPPGLDLESRRKGGTVVEDFPNDVAGASGHVRGVRESPGRIELAVQSDASTVVVARESWAPGWSARVNGTGAAVLRADGRHLAVRIDAGTSHVALRYRPAHTASGLWLTLAAASVCVVLAGRRSAARPAGAAPNVGRLPDAGT